MKYVENGRFQGVNNFDWFGAQRRMNQQPVIGTQASVTPQSAPTAICGRSLDDSVVAGGVSGIPIAPNSIGAGMLGGNAYPAPTYQPGSYSETDTVDVQGVSTNALVSVIFNNVPQDGTVEAIMWVFRKSGETTWIPWAMTQITGLPNPPATQTQSFKYGQLINGQLYDFAACYVGANGSQGAIGYFALNRVAASMGIPTSYQLGGTTIAPALTGVSQSVSPSANGVNGSVGASLTTTNQPTDGSLSRVSFFLRRNGDTAWTFYASVPAVGVGQTSPPASGTYSFYWTDLTLGIGYDFGVAYENSQGGESSVSLIFTLTAAQLGMSIPTSNLAQMSPGQGISIASASVGAFQNAGAPWAKLPFTATTNNWALGANPAWFLAVRAFLRVNGSGSTTGQPLGDFFFNSGTTAISGEASLAAGGKFDIGFAYVDNQNNISSIAWPAGTSGIVVPLQDGANTLVGAGNGNQLPDAGFDAMLSASPWDPYWNFYNIDGVNVLLLPAGGPGGSNNFAVRAAVSGRLAWGRSQKVTIPAGQQMCYSMYIDARTCSGNAPYIRLCDASGATTLAGPISQTNGTNGFVSGTYTPVAQTDVYFEFNSNSATISSSNLIFSAAQLEIGSQRTPWKPGPLAGSGVHSTGGTTNPVTNPGIPTQIIPPLTPIATRNLLRNAQQKVTDSAGAPIGFTAHGSPNALFLDVGALTINGKSYTCSGFSVTGNQQGSGYYQILTEEVEPGDQISYACWVNVNGGGQAGVAILPADFSAQYNSSGVSAVQGQLPALDAAFLPVSGTTTISTNWVTSAQAVWTLIAGTITIPNGAPSTIALAILQEGTASSQVLFFGARIWRGTKWQPYTEAPDPTQDHSGAVGTSSGFNGQASMLKTPSDFTLSYNFPSGQTTMTYYAYGSDTGGSGSVVTFRMPDGSKFTVNAIASSASPNSFNAGVTGATVYALIYWSRSTSAWVTNFQTSAFTDAVVWAAYKDGYIAILASYTSNAALSGTTGSGGGGTHGGGNIA